MQLKITILIECGNAGMLLEYHYDTCTMFTRKKTISD